MTILILERVPLSLRGQLTRWMIEVRAGVFVGKTSALVREKLWERACKHSKGGGCVLIHNARTEQGSTYGFMALQQGDRRHGRVEAYSRSEG